MKPRVAFFGLASDFGCQVQITNADSHLLDVLNQFDLVYWQLVSSGHVPDSYDIAIVEGAATTQEHVDLLKKIRETAKVVVAIGACAITGGIPHLAAKGDLHERFKTVYGESSPLSFEGRLSPEPIDTYIPVDYNVPGCPIEPAEFVQVLQRAIMELSDPVQKTPLCASCKIAGNVCFYEKQEVCLGLIARDGCGVKCVSRGRSCMACRGIAVDANIAGALIAVESYGVPSSEFLDALEIYNSSREVVAQ